ncbi:hypothetical protein [Streptomyces sp. NPDC048256]|uniref:hypothetical protein n=1 Tax=Streptomyces sp. NPDC048256 TaxID=3154613 RepID=UPI0033F33F9E
MNSVPQHLHSEDRQEYERILDEALRSAPHHPELAAVGQRLNPEQLRTMALNASALITVAAAAEYQHYVKVREELRHPAPSMGLATTMGEAVQAAEAAGASARWHRLGRLISSGVAAQRWARMSYGRRLLAAVIGMHVRPQVDGRITWEAANYRELSAQVDLARNAWREALLERGILPFLQQALAEVGTAARRPTAPPAPTGRLPKIGYDRPGFSSPDDRTPGRRPSYTSPDYTSPDFGGPERQLE